jgi:chromosome segregation ATPase
LDEQIEEVLNILSQYSADATAEKNPLIGQLAALEDQLMGSGKTIWGLQTRLTENESEVAAVSARLAEREQALEMFSRQLEAKDGMVQTLSTQIAEALQKAKDEDLLKEVAEKDELLQEFSILLGDKDEALRELRAEKETALQKHSALLAEKNAALQGLSAERAEKESSLQALSTQLAEKDGTVQMLSIELAEQHLAHQSQTQHDEERIGDLSARLLNTETQLKRMRNTFGWRLLSSFGRIKYRFLLPVYRLLGKVSTE